MAVLPTARFAGVQFHDHHTSREHVRLVMDEMDSEERE